MLPPGHAAAGTIVGLGVATIFSQPYEPYAWLGAVCGALPDLDMFAAFYRTRSMVIENDKQSHRSYITHTPLFWLVAAGVVSLAGGLAAGLIVLLAPLSHLFFDSLEDEIRWLWPLSHKGYRMLKRSDLDIPHESFVSYWRAFLCWYFTHRRLTATLEALLIVIVLLYAGGKETFSD